MSGGAAEAATPVQQTVPPAVELPGLLPGKEDMNTGGTSVESERVERPAVKDGEAREESKGREAGEASEEDLLLGDLFKDGQLPAL
jgi:hypothetical protein